MHLHQTFGLIVRSDIMLPELLAASGGEPDVIVSLGNVEPLRWNSSEDRKWFRGGEGWLQFEVEGVARFFVEAGTRIVVDAEPAAAERDIRLFLLGSGFGALMMQRGFVVLHGSTVVFDAGAVSFLGESGVGKSTLAAAFRQEGFLLLSDDLCVISTDGDILVRPGYPQHKLWIDSLNHLRLESNGLKRVRQGMDKRALPVEKAYFCETICRLSRLYALSKSSGASVEVKRFSGGTKLAALLACRYRPEFVEAMKLEFGQFEQLGRVAGEIPLALISRPDGRFAVDELVARVLSDLEDED